MKSGRAQSPVEREWSMSGTPAREGSCCPQRDDQVTLLKIGERGVVVGLMGLDLIFQQLVSLGCLPYETTDTELVGMTRRSTISPIKPPSKRIMLGHFAKHMLVSTPGRNRANNTTLSPTICVAAVGGLAGGSTDHRRTGRYQDALSTGFA